MVRRMAISWLSIAAMDRFAPSSIELVGLNATFLLLYLPCLDDLNLVMSGPRFGRNKVHHLERATLHRNHE